MVDIAQLKRMASESFPEALYHHLEPHLEAVSRLCEDLANEQSLREQCEQEFYLDIRDRHNSLWDAFLEASRPQWCAFARERWPEIDEYFDLTPRAKEVSKRLEDFVGDPPF